MKLTIQEIRTAYRNATDKEAVIKELAASEEVSEQMIKFYVRGNTGPVRSTETPAQYITEAFSPVPEKKRGRPVKKHDEVKAANDLAETVIEMPKIMNAVSDPVIEVKTLPVIHPTEVSLEEREMFFADIEDAADPFSALRKVKEMCWPPKIELPPLRVLSEAAADDELLWQEIFSLREKLKIAVEAIKSYEPEFDAQLFVHRLNSVDYDQLMEELSGEEPCSTCKKPPIGIMPRYIWEEKRASEVAAAIIRCAEAAHPILIEWVEEHNERCSK